MLTVGSWCGRLTHAANGDDDLAAASRLTRDRSKVLLSALLPRMRGLVEEVQQLRTAVVPWTNDTPPESADKVWLDVVEPNRAPMSPPSYVIDHRVAIASLLGRSGSNSPRSGGTTRSSVRPSRLCSTRC